MKLEEGVFMGLFSKNIELNEEIVKNGNCDEIKKIYDHHDINAVYGFRKRNALFYNLDEDMLQWLFDKGADIEFKDRYGSTPLYAHAGRTEGKIKKLLELGADVCARNQKNETALHRAAKNFQLENIQFLIDAGADINAENVIGETPMVSAMQRSYNLDILHILPVVKLFLSNGAKITPQANEQLSRICKDFEWTRNQFTQEYLNQIEPAIEELKSLFEK